MIKKRLTNLLSTDGTLQQKTIKSGFWSFASRFSTRGLDLIKLVIVARLLSPNDFGLLGIALLTLSIFRVFTQTGFKESIIQNKNDVKEHLNTAWTTLILRGILLYTIVFLSAPLVALFFAEPRATLILQVIGLTLVLEGFQNIAIVYLRKELVFQKRFILDLGRTLPSFILTVTLAFILQNVWALVYGTLIGGIGMLFISYLVHPYRPKLEFNKEKAKEMFGFGKWVFAGSLIVFLCTQGDDVILGKILGATALGFYQLSYQISNTPATEITHVISQVTFPAYSKIKDNIKNLREGFFKTCKFISLITFPLTALIYLLIPEFIIIFMGEKWLPIVWPVRILVISGLIRSIQAISGPLFLGYGKPEMAFKINLFRVFFIFITIYPLILIWGISGASLSVLIGITSTMPYWYIKTSNILKANAKSYIISFLPAIFGFLFSFTLIFFIKKIFTTNIVNFIIIASLGIITYLVSIYIYDKIFKNNILSELKGLITDIF